MVPALANVLATELSTLYYGLLSRRAKPPVTLRARAFSIYERVGKAELVCGGPDPLCNRGRAPAFALETLEPDDSLDSHRCRRLWHDLADWTGTGVPPSAGSGGRGLAVSSIRIAVPVARAGRDGCRRTQGRSG
jgi:hypothetical protein